METPGPAREVPVDVLPPVPADAQPHLWAKPGEPPLGGLKNFYHPASGVVILGLDSLFFVSELFTGFFDMPVACVLAFILTFPLVFVIQKKWGRDSISSAFGKAFVGAFLAGLPLPISGTLVGAAVLIMSGLPHHPLEMAKRIFSGRPIANQK
jgi:hypothetical protein